MTADPGVIRCLIRTHNLSENTLEDCAQNSYKTVTPLSNKDTFTPSRQLSGLISSEI